jgi:hypothetical protein
LPVRQPVRARPKLRRDGAKQDAGPHRVDRLVRRHQQGRRRLARHHLQGGEQSRLLALVARHLGHQTRFPLAQFAQTGALAGDQGVVLSDRCAQGRQLAIQIGDLVRGLIRLGSQATGAGALVPILGLQARDIALLRRRGGNGQGDQASQNDREGETHQSR